MAGQNHGQKNDDLKWQFFFQNGPNDPKGLVFANWRFMGRFKPFLLQ